ncbi:hypothetical protein LCGC14_3096630 [marine sediment metagenome]|uniref:IstB-like ATP-binding domain-containing protein n=1 Tax=marine sediment metagenome TaxID=412755 RepID=A0A0F8YGF1_9ZZZZ
MIRCIRSEETRHQASSQCSLRHKLASSLPAGLSPARSDGSKYSVFLLCIFQDRPDDFGYVKKSEQETAVLFELICERYERRSILLTCNQPFKDWDEIFADKMMAVAAIDRLVHHATILEIRAESYRRKVALGRAGGPSAPGVGPSVASDESGQGGPSYE